MIVVKDDKVSFGITTEHNRKKQITAFIRKHKN